MSSPIITVENISKSFKISGQYPSAGEFAKNIFRFSREYKRAVDNVSFKINKGDMIGFIGPNGAGKTVTVKMLSGILRPDEGQIHALGLVPYQHRKEYVANIGVVFGQKSQITYDLTPLDTYGVLKCIYKIPDQLYQDNLERFCEMLDIREYINAPVYSLSMGQRIRAELVCALLHSPSLLFLDEPTIGIDVIGKEKIRNCLRELNRTDHITMIFTSHDMKDIEETCDRLIIMDGGKKIYDGSREKIYKNYRNKRMMEVEFDELPSNINLKNVTYEDSENSPMSKYLHFNLSEINYNDMISELMEKYPVRDISVKEPDIETVIRDIYRGNVEIR